VAADRSAGPFKDRIYAVWANSYAGGSNILLSYSSIAARVGQAVMVNDDRQPFDLPNGECILIRGRSESERSSRGDVYDRRGSRNNWTGRPFYGFARWR